MELILPAVITLAGIGAASSAVLQMLFFGGPFLDIVNGVLKLLGISGRPRNAATEANGLLLANSSVPRISQLGRALYFGARAYGRILSNPQDQRAFIIPAFQATANDLRLNGQQRAWLTLALQRGNYRALELLDNSIPAARKVKLCPPGMHLVGQNCRPCSYAPNVNPCAAQVHLPTRCPAGSHLESGRCVLNPRIQKRPADCCG